MKISDIINVLSGVFISYRNKEHIIKRRNGYLSDKTLYVIRISHMYNGGLMNILYHVIERLKYVEQQGYIPLVQIGDNYTSYNVYNRCGKYVNVWEYWFEQPTEYGFSDFAIADRVIIGEAHHNEQVFFQHLPVSFLYDEEKMKYACYLCEKYIHIRTNILKEIENDYPLFYDKNVKILGVSYKSHLYTGSRHCGDTQMRGDYWHANIYATVERVKKSINDRDYDYIFLSTPDGDACDAFRENFGDRLILTNRVRIPKTQTDTSTYSKEYSSKYEYGKTYIVDILLLSRCFDIIAPIDNGTVLALLFNNMRYDKVDLFNVGSGNDYSDEMNNEIIDWCLDDKKMDFAWRKYGNYGDNDKYINDWTD